MTVEDSGPSFSRRGLIKSTAGVAGAATVGVGSQKLDIGPVEESEAIHPVVMAGSAIAVGWALRETGVIGSADPPEGLTPDALTEQLYTAVQARESNNSSTFVDNRNILDGVEHSAYAEGKIAAIEALNEQKSQSAVETAAIDAVENYLATIESNFLKSWNESVQELGNLRSTVDSHPDLSWSDIEANPDGRPQDTDQGQPTTITLFDGTNFEIEQVSWYYNGSSASGTYQYNPVTHNYGGGASNPERYMRVPISPTDYDKIVYLDRLDWKPLHDDFLSHANNVTDGLILWVDKIYGDVQSGELDTEELLTPRELAAMTAGEERVNQAISDLMALNIAVNLEREAEVYLPYVGATIYGQIATTESGTLETGTIDPTADDASYYITYDLSQGEGDWSAYETAIDGGVVTFTQEPFQKTEFHIDTVANETATVTYDDFSEDSGTGNWTVDVSDQLENSITEIDAVQFYATVEETQFETVRLQKEFEIVTFTDSEGNEHDSSDFTREEPQNDSNYITQAEWDQNRKRQLKLIKKYEDSQNDGVGLPEINGEDLFSDIPGSAWLIAGGAAIAAVVVGGGVLRR